MKQRQPLIYLSITLICLFLVGSCQFIKPELKTETAFPPFRLGFTNWPGCAVWQIAYEQGIFSKNNLNIDLRFYDYTTGISMFSDNQIDGNCQSLYDTIYIRGNDSKVDPVIVALTDWSVGGDQLIAGANIKNMQQLKGKKVAFETGTVPYFFVILALEKSGIKLSDIQPVNQDLIRNIALFLEEEVDAVGTYIPFVKEALHRPDTQTLITSEEFPGAISDHLVINRQFLRNDPQLIQALVKSWFDTVEFIQKNPELSRQIIANTSGLTTQDLKQYESQISIKGLSENLKAFEPGDSFASLPYAAEKIYEFLQKNQLIEKTVEIDRILDPQFVYYYRDHQ